MRQSQTGCYSKLSITELAASRCALTASAVFLYPEITFIAQNM